MLPRFLAPFISHLCFLLFDSRFQISSISSYFPHSSPVYMAAWLSTELSQIHHFISPTKKGGAFLGWAGPGRLFGFVFFRSVFSSSKKERKGCLEKWMGKDFF